MPLVWKKPSAPLNTCKPTNLADKKPGVPSLVRTALDASASQGNALEHANQALSAAALSKAIHCQLGRPNAGSFWHSELLLCTSNSQSPAFAAALIRKQKPYVLIHATNGTTYPPCFFCVHAYKNFRASFYNTTAASAGYRQQPSKWTNERMCVRKYQQANQAIYNDAALPKLKQSYSIT